MEAQPSSDPICRRFSVDEIRSATQNFDEALVVGRGGFGKVYKGTIVHGSTTIVAIKRLHSMSDQGAQEFLAEVEMLSKLRHCNLVPLIGCCNDGNEMVLVYEYMPRGNLEDRLHKPGLILSWLQRVRICLGVARGLDYLHTGVGTRQGVIHRDVKSSNVLLDENFAAKISDFGLAKIGPINQTRTHVSTGVKGTFGYMDPCYFFTGNLTRRSDVYSFGVLLLEVICGRPAVDTSLDEEQWGLASWAQDQIKEGKLNQIIDSRLQGQISSNCAKDFARMARGCLHNLPNKRPTTAQIIASLENILSLQERLDSSLTEGKYINKVWSFFSSKVQLKSRDKAANKLVKEAKVYWGPNLPYNYYDGYRYSSHELLDAEVDSVFISKTSYWETYRVNIPSGKLVMRRMKALSLEGDIVHGKIRALRKLFHTNILAPKDFLFIGDFKEEMLYITDYISSSVSLSSLLHGANRRSRDIGWFARLSIIIGVTKGLVYLHEEAVVHGHLTSRNVLIVEGYKPLIVDIGLSQFAVDAKPNSTIDHAPELLRFQDESKETDVYSLGLIMLELLSRKSTDPERHEVEITSWVRSIPREKLRAEVLDPELKREIPNIKQDLVRVLEVAMACVSISPKARPKVAEVLKQLVEISLLEYQ